MILKIRKIRNLGLFRNYHWDAELPAFCRYNLIYGWNGSGKTTFSRLFAALNEGKLDKYPHLEYEIETEGGTVKNGASFGEQIRVFNKDYVQANVERLGGPNPIFILGDENKKLAEEVDKDEKEVANRTDALKAAQDELASLEMRRGNIFTDIARTISQNVSGELTRNYRKPNAEEDFSVITAKTLLLENEITLYKGTISQRQKPVLDYLPQFNQVQIELDVIINDAGTLLNSEVSSVVIEELAKYADISQWVEQGLVLHEEHKSKNCQFCNQELPKDRIKALAEHFNEADKVLKNKIDEQTSRLEQIWETLENLPIREASNIYDELQVDYQKYVEELRESRDKLVVAIHDLGEKVNAKKTKTTEKLVFDVGIDPVSYVMALSNVNELIEKHNLKSENFEKEKEIARKKLKIHYLSEIFDDVKKLDADIKAQREKISKLEGDDLDISGTPSIRALRDRIIENRSKISSSHKACMQINDNLNKFLGRSELLFEVSGEGYIVKRYGEVAEDLSEGEKTAIAFVYFTVQLLDQDFNLRDGIVVIDDPISSLDSNSLFQAFAFLKESVKDAKQVFILTHNFEFMRQVKNWFFHIKKVGGKFQRSLYMINNREVDARRIAYLALLDKLLIEYESEYHYLFSLLQNFKDNGTLESVYNFPNIGRKFLETFLAFKVPSRENLHEKMSHIEYDEARKTAILRFVETHSHAARSDGVLNFDMTLSNGGQNVVTSLLAMIEHVDAIHYETLMEATTRN